MKDQPVRSPVFQACFLCLLIGIFEGGGNTYLATAQSEPDPTANSSLHVRILEEEEQPKFETQSIRISEEQEPLQILTSGNFLEAGCSSLLMRNPNTKVLSLLHRGNIRAWNSPVSLTGKEEFNQGDFDGDGIDEILVFDSDRPKRLLGSDQRNGFFEKSGLLSQAEQLLSTSSIQVLGEDNRILSYPLERHEADSNVWKFERSPSRVEVFAEYPRSTTWTEAGFADFNGDLQSDHLADGGRFHGWWLTLGSRDGGLSQRISGIDFSSSEAQRLILADVDCDGAADVIAAEQYPTSHLKIAFSRLSRRISDITVEGTAGERCISDAKGECTLLRPVEHPSVLHHGYLFEELSRLSDRLGKATSTITFLASPLSIQDEPRGQRFGGGKELKGPYVCLGFNPHESTSVWWREEARCPKNHALVGVSLPKSAFKWAKTGTPRWACCPLPVEDLLTEEPLTGTNQCPDQSVAVGAEPGWKCPSCDQKLICQKVNLSRYKLDVSTPGVYWGVGRFRERNRHQVLLSDVPPALRSALGRTGLTTWDVDGCLGYPWGSLLTAMPNERSCDKAEFRRVLNRFGEPLQMFPNCSALDDPQSPRGRCLR